MKNALIILIGIIAVGGWLFPHTPLQFGGTKIAIFQGGTGTTTAPAGQVIVGGATYQSRATTTVSCLGSLSCTSFDVLGNTPVTITNAFPFTPTTNFNVNTSATSTPLWARQGIFASSTSYIASTTFAITGNVSIGTSSQSGLLNLGPMLANGSSTISAGKMQWDAYDSGGTRRCFFFNPAGALTSSTGSCN